MKEYLKSCDEVMTHYNTTQNGLSSNESAARLASNGKNKLQEGKKEYFL
jgi:magnesium-transporting ATPase (P-type)